MVHWYWLIVALAAGGFTTSLVEYRLHYNLTDEEIDILKGIFAKVTATEKTVVASIGRRLSKLEFWKRA